MKEIVKHLSNDLSKVNLVYKSLESEEDRLHLKGVTSFSEVMVHLEERYFRPNELVSATLARGTNSEFAGDDDSIMKANILAYQRIARELKKLAMSHRIDTFYISSIKLRRRSLQRRLKERPRRKQEPCYHLQMTVTVQMTNLLLTVILAQIVKIPITLQNLAL